MINAASKILGFGGDYAHIEPVYSHFKIAAEQLRIGLTELSEDGWLTVPTALDIARRVLRDNPIECCRIDKKRQALRQATRTASQTCRPRSLAPPDALTPIAPRTNLLPSPGRPALRSVSLDKKESTRRPKAAPVLSGGERSQNNPQRQLGSRYRAPQE